MAPGLLPQRQMQCLNRFFRGLLRGETRPLVPTRPPGIRSLFQGRAALAPTNLSRDWTFGYPP